MDLPRPDLGCLLGLASGVLQQPLHAVQTLALLGQRLSLLIQQLQQGLGAAARQVVPDLPQGGPQPPQGGDEVVYGQLPGRIVAVAVLPHPLGLEQTDVVVVEQGVLLHPAQGGKLRRLEDMLFHAVLPFGKNLSVSP